MVKPQAQNRDEFIEECRSGALDGTFVIYRTFESVETTGRFDDEMIRSLPASVRFICHNGTTLHLIASYLENVERL